MKLKTIIIVLYLFIFQIQVFSQNITISTAGTPQSMVSSLATGCSEINNVVYTGAPNAIGTFANGESLGISEGVILSTGNVSNAIGPNSSGNTASAFGQPGDALFDATFGFPSTDAAVLEFDFVAYGNNAFLTFIFASEAYPELNLTQLADAMGIFVTGPGVGNIPYNNTNIALVPGTSDSITNGTINNVMGSAFYVENTNNFFEFDGYTIPINLSFATVPCVSYHIKIVVADLNPAFDSAILIGSESFKTDFALTIQNYSTSGGLYDLTEGCTNTLVVVRQDMDTLTAMPYILPFDLTITGTSTEGVDFVGISTGQYFISPYEAYISIDYTAIIDNLTEGIETIIFTFSHPSLCDSSCTAIYEIEIDIIDNYPLVAGIVENDTGICATLTSFIDLHTYLPTNMDPSTVSYSWSTNANSANTPSVNIAPPQGVQSLYCVTITDECEQSTVDCINVTNSDFSGIQLITEDNICFGDEFGTVVVLENGGMGPYYYQWNAGGLGTDSTNNINNMPAGSFGVTVTDTIGCTFNSNFVITQPDSIYYSTSVFDPKCHDFTDGSILFQMFAGVPTYTYQWSNGETTPSLSNIPAGTYVVTTSDQNGCGDIITIVVNEPDPLVLSASSDVAICLGQTTPLNAEVIGGTPMYYYSWSDGASGPFTSVTPATSTIYTVQATDINGCLSNIEEISITIYPAISVQLSTSNDSICVGDETSIYANISGGTGGPYLAVFTDGASSNILPPPYSISPVYTTTYDIIVSDFCNSPTGHYSLTINVFEPPDIEISSDINKGCRPLVINFEDLNYDENNTYHWSYGDGSNELLAHTAYPPHTFINEGLYDVTLEVVSAAGCKNTAVMEEMINVYPIPSAKFYTAPDIVSIVKPIVFFDNISYGASIYTWDFGDLSDTSNAISPEHTYNSIGRYNIKLIAENEFGCIDSVNHYITVRNEYTFYVPNVFSPSSQIPQNRTFIPVGEGIDPHNFHMIIYNRWGNKIYETYDLNHPWDGKLGDKHADIGTSFPWVVVYKDFNGEEHQESGVVTVLE